MNEQTEYRSYNAGEIKNQDFFRVQPSAIHRTELSVDPDLAMKYAHLVKSGDVFEEHKKRMMKFRNDMDMEVVKMLDNKYTAIIVDPSKLSITTQGSETHYFYEGSYLFTQEFRYEGDKVICTIGRKYISTADSPINPSYTK